MSARAYVVIAIIAVVIIAGIVWAEIRRDQKTAEDLEHLDTADSGDALDVLEDIRARGDSVEDELLERLTGRHNERLRAAMLLGEVGTPEKSGPRLVELMDDQWEPVRRAAVVSIGQLGYLEGLPTLLQMLKDSEQEMDTRCLAVQSISLLRLKGLADLDGEIAVQPLIAILERRPEVPPVEEEEEADEGEEDATDDEEEKIPGIEVPAAEAEPADKEIELRRECVLALGLIGSPDALEAVFESADDTMEPSALVRHYACMAIEDVRTTPSDEGLAMSMGEALYDALEDTEADVRMAAAMALRKHTEFDDGTLDGNINAKLLVMAQELSDSEDADAGYWAREAAREACDSRHISLQAASSAHGEGSS